MKSQNQNKINGEVLQIVILLISVLKYIIILNPCENGLAQIGNCQALYKINKYGNSFSSRSISEMSGNAEHVITKRRLAELIQKCERAEPKWEKKAFVQEHDCHLLV